MDTALLSRKLHTVQEIIQGCGAAARQYGVGPWRIWPRFLGLYRKRFSPREIFLWGLLDPGLGTADLAGYVSKENLLRLQRRYNPAEHANLVEDKAVFYTRCAGLGLPAPETLAIFDAERAWLTAESRFVSLPELIAYLGEQGRPELVIKPADGVYGDGVRLLSRTAEGWHDHSGRPVDAAALAAYCRDHAAYRRFLLQPRLHNHGSIRQLTGTGTLQTVRVITCSAGDGAPGRIILANWRIAGHEGIADNFDYGRAGNLLADVAVDTGRVRRVIAPQPDRQGTRSVSAHPVTGQRLDGFRLPDWNAVRELLLAGSSHFAPLRLIGWDVALTDDGPVLLEANAWFDAGQNAFRALPAVLEGLGARDSGYGRGKQTAGGSDVRTAAD